MARAQQFRGGLWLSGVLSLGACASRAAVQGSAIEASGTVVVANMTDGTASVLDVASRRTLATLPTPPGPHEVAVSHDGRWAVVSGYGVRGAPGHTLTVIDLAAAGGPAVARTIDVGGYQRPHSMTFLPGDSLLAVSSEVRRVVVLVDFARGTVADTIPTTQATSHMVAVTPDGRRAFTANISSGSITELDVAGRRMVRVIPVAPAVEGIAVTPSGDAVWVGSNQTKTVSVVDTRRGAVVDTLGGFGLPYRLAVTPDGRTVVIADPEKGEVVLVDAATRRRRATVSVPADGVVASAEVKGSSSPEGIVLSRDGRAAYVALQGLNRVGVIDLTTATLVATMPVGAWPDGIGYSPRVIR